MYRTNIWYGNLLLFALVFGLNESMLLEAILLQNFAAFAQTTMREHMRMLVRETTTHT